MNTVKLLFFLILCTFFVPHSIDAQSAQNEDFFDGTVTAVIEESIIIEENGNKHPYQRLQLIGTSGKYKGKSVVIENGKFDQVGVLEYKQGDKVIVQSTKLLGGIETFSISDYQRRSPLLLLALLFVVLTIIVGGKRGLRSLIGMVVTFILLFIFVLPQLYKGSNPVFISAILSFIVVPTTFLLSHGVNRKTFCAIIGTSIALIIAAILAFVFINQSHLSGFASEEAGFLDVIKKGTIDIRGLLFAGIIIALLGVLEDITIAQAAIVVRLKEANSKLHLLELFKRGMDIGRDHIASMANTLILVYAGASLPLLLLFIDSSTSPLIVMNSEVIAEEIVRTLVASIGLILAVPITTLITAFVASSSNFSSKKT